MIKNEEHLRNPGYTTYSPIPLVARENVEESQPSELHQSYHSEGTPGADFKNSFSDAWAGIKRRVSGNPNPPTAIHVDDIDYKNFLPPWGYNKDVAAYADEQGTKKKLVRMQACVGPAIPLASLALVVFWGCYIGITIFGVGSAKCTSLHSHVRLKAIYGCVMIFRLVIEFKCLQYVTIPYIQTLGRFQWMNKTIPFQCWLGIVLGALSVPNLIDMLTDSLFFISATENYKCYQAKHSSEMAVMKFWRAVLLESRLDWLAHHHYAAVAGGIWIFTWLQMLYPLVECSPRCWRQEDYDFKVGGEKTKFTNLMGRSCNFGDTLYQLADATGMGSLAVQQPEYPRARERMRREQHKGEDFNPQSSLQFLRAALSEGMISVGLVGALENVPQILLQSLVFSVFRAVRNLQTTDVVDSFETQTVISICFSCLICLTKLWKTAVLLLFFREVRSAIRDTCSWNLSPQDLKTYRGVRAFAIVLFIWGMVILIGVIMALVQTLATESCGKDGIWLIHRGCFSIMQSNFEKSHS